MHGLHTIRQYQYNDISVGPVTLEGPEPEYRVSGLVAVENIICHVNIGKLEYRKVSVLASSHRSNKFMKSFRFKALALVHQFSRRFAYLVVM